VVGGSCQGASSDHGDHGDPIRSPRGGVLRFYGRGGRVVLRAEPQGDGWWWMEGDAGVAIAAVGRPGGRPVGRLHDVDLEVVASLDAATLRCGGGTWPVDRRRRAVGAARDPAVAVEVDDGVMVVRHHDGIDRRVAALVALVLPPPSPYVTPTRSPAMHPIPLDHPVRLVGDAPRIALGIFELFR
jgi:hypothetical protein